MELDFEKAPGEPKLDIPKPTSPEDYMDPLQNQEMCSSPVVSRATFCEGLEIAARPVFLPFSTFSIPRPSASDMSFSSLKENRLNLQRLLNEVE